MHSTGQALKPADPGFEQINGELDAGIVFAVAASQYSGTPFGHAALSDARDCYVKALAALPKVNATGAQLQLLKAKLIRIRELIGDVTVPMTNAAA